MQETMNEQASGTDINLQELLLVYFRKWWIILVCLILGAAIAFGGTYLFVTPLYQAKISIYVNNNKSFEGKDYLSGADLSAAQRLVNTYVTVATSERVLDKISERLDGKYDSEQLSRMITAEQLNDTEIFCVYVLHEDPAEAARIANTAADVAPVEIAEVIDGTSARIIDSAKVPTTRYSPSYSRMALLGGVVGALSAVVCLSIHHLSKTRSKY